MKNMSVATRLASAAGLLVALIFSTASAGSILYGATGSGGVSSTLYSVNTATGAGTVIGAIGFNASGIAFDPTTGILYGLSGRVDAGPAELFTINTTTGAGTLIASVTGAVTDAFPDITFDSSGQLYAWSETCDCLIRINKATATVTFVGPIIGSAVTGLAFSHAGVLYREVGGTLSTIDPVMGLVVSALPGTGRVVGMGMDFDQFDQLYALERVTAGPTGSRNLVTVNTSTGLVTTVGPTVAGFDALAFSPVSVPEPASLALLGVGLVGLGFSRRNR